MFPFIAPDGGPTAGKTPNTPSDPSSPAASSHVTDVSFEEIFAGQAPSIRFVQLKGLLRGAHEEHGIADRDDARPDDSADGTVEGLPDHDPVENGAFLMPEALSVSEANPALSPALQSSLSMTNDPPVADGSDALRFVADDLISRADRGTNVINVQNIATHIGHEARMDWQARLVKTTPMPSTKPHQARPAEQHRAAVREPVVQIDVTRVMAAYADNSAVATTTEAAKLSSRQIANLPVNADGPTTENLERSANHGSVATDVSTGSSRSVRQVPVSHYGNLGLSPGAASVPFVSVLTASFVTPLTESAATSDHGVNHLYDAAHLLRRASSQIAVSSDPQPSTKAVDPSNATITFPMRLSLDWSAIQKPDNPSVDGSGPVAPITDNRANAPSVGQQPSVIPALANMRTPQANGSEVIFREDRLSVGGAQPCHGMRRHSLRLLRNHLRKPLQVCPALDRSPFNAWQCL